MFELTIDFKEDGNVYTAVVYPEDKEDALRKLEEKKAIHDVIHATLTNIHTRNSIVLLDHTAA